MKYSVIVPCYNEELVLPVFLPRMLEAAAQLGPDFEIILINDGSADLTWSVIKDAASKESRIKGICLSRNFGHQLAVTAGLSYATGDRTLIIDADLQDPPELIVPMSAKMDEGYDVVFGKRKAREGETFFKKFTAAVFYRILKSLTSFEIPVDAGDFRLINKRVLEVLQAMPERDRYLRGMVAWVGGKQIGLEYDRDERALGETKYTFKKMLKLAIDGITSFSTSPLRIATTLSFFATFLTLLVGGYVLYSYLFLNAVRGWSSMMVVVSVFFALMFFCMGILGEYIGRIFDQVKARPMFLVSESENFEAKVLNRVRSVTPPQAEL